MGAISPPNRQRGVDQEVHHWLLTTARRGSWGKRVGTIPNPKKQPLIQQFLLSDSVTLPLSLTFFHSSTNQVLLSVSLFHLEILSRWPLEILLFVSSYTNTCTEWHTSQQSDETSLSVRGRHEWAGALIIDRMIKADEQGFLPQRKIWLPVSSCLVSREHAGGGGSGSIHSILAERGSVSHAVPDY